MSAAGASAGGWFVTHQSRPDDEHADRPDRRAPAPDAAGPGQPGRLRPGDPGPAAGRAPASGQGPTREGPPGSAVDRGRPAATPPSAPSTPDETDEPPVEPYQDDPEWALADAEFSYDPDSLRETGLDRSWLRSVREALSLRLADADDDAKHARLLGVRAVTYRLLGDLTSALADARQAVRHAEATRQLRRISLARARLARVHQWRGEYADADRLYAQADSVELPARLRASMAAHAARSAYEQGRLVEACQHLDRCVDLRQDSIDEDFAAELDLLLAAIERRAAERGFGPPVRTRDELLGIRRPAGPDRAGDRWRYPALAGDFADAQPFRDGVAWVRRAADQDCYELISASGATLVSPDAGYDDVRPFSDGLGWVCGPRTGGWIAIDPAGRVVVEAGYDDVRAFRSGVAVVRRAGGWGAVDLTGRTVLSCSWDVISTPLADGRYVDGFTEEGHAVVERGGLKGVVDRSGRLVVPPRYRTLVIHPVAYLIGSADGRWGALDRRGSEVIPPIHGSRAEVLRRLERLLSDARPVL